ncbi:AraC family transcriptional regulator [Streptomyces sp. NPDC005373]|uniref:AraC family transcriptional regulator n=1 Tax=Streptomyces sp. NPDC005373 TaxID=3156879 RepID=UPI0033B5F446
MMDARTVREVSGHLASAVVADTGSAHIEVVRRHSTHPVNWRLRQPRAVLYWYRSGITMSHLRVADRWRADAVRPNADLTVIPPGLAVEGRLEVGPVSTLAIVLFDADRLEQASGVRLTRPLVGFSNAALKRGLADLAVQAERPGRFFEMSVEGWTLQLQALLGHLTSADEDCSRYSGGMTTRNVRMVADHISAHLAGPLSVLDLARLCGLSERHFLRSFTSSFGTTPARYIATRRLGEAKRLLAETSIGIADIAADCGYAHAQHFTTWFKKTTGMTPSRYRDAMRRSAVRAGSERVLAADP